MSSMEIAGIRFDGLTRTQVLGKIKSEFTFLATLNAEYIVRSNRDPKFRKIFQSTLNVIDGQLPYLIARIYYPNLKIEKISGCEFAEDLCKMAAEESWGVFLLGGQKNSNAEAVKILANKYSCRIQGYSPPQASLPFPETVERQILDALITFQPKVLLVGFGTGKQEQWLVDHQIFLRNLGVQVVCGVGGTFEIVSGVLPRAPKWLQVMCLEGVYRLLREPKLFRLKRLWTSLFIFKYLMSNPRQLNTSTEGESLE